MATKKTKTNGDEILNFMQEMQKSAQKLNLDSLQTRGGAVARGVDVCAVYLKIRPALEFIKDFPLIPKKIRDGIKLLMSALDTFCPR